MAVPNYQTLMRPLLELARDGLEHSTVEAIDALALQMKISDIDRRELLPSGQQSRFDNRVGWAKTYLSKAGLLEKTGRARFRITQRGMQLLTSYSGAIDNKILQQYPEYQEFQLRSPLIKDGISTGITQFDPESQSEIQQTPQEVLDISYQILRQNLAQDLLERVKASPPQFFERLVVDLLVRMGYGGSRRDAGEAIGRSGDEGIDGIIKEDRLGLDIVYIQAKRWEGVVGRPTVQAFAGSLEGHRARKGVLITTSHFTNEARDYVNRIEKKIVLIDGEQLAQYMIDFNVGATEEVTYIVKRIDSDYFGDE